MIGRLNNTILKPHLTYLYFNVYLLKSVLFGCRVVNINNKQDKILCSVYEEIILLKLGLRKKFLHYILYTRDNAVGIRLFKPKTAIAMLSMKLYIRKKEVKLASVK